MWATEGNTYGASWSSRGVISVPEFGPIPALYRVPATGGTPVASNNTGPRRRGRVSHRLYLGSCRTAGTFCSAVRMSGSSSSSPRALEETKSGIYVGDLESKQKITVPTKGRSCSIRPFRWSSLYSRTHGIAASPLMAQAFDVSTFRSHR